MSFDWKTEESIHWDDPPDVTPEPEKDPQRRRRWLGLLLILGVLLIGGGLATYGFLKQRIDAATEETELDVTASYTVIENAAQARDAELFATFLSGREKAWAQAMEQQVRHGRYLDREAFGLTWQPVDPATAVISQTVNPRFNSVELLLEHAYSYPIGNGYTETVRLQQTAVYRRGPDRWLLSPPNEEFWGQTVTKAGYYLTLHYPERDAEIAARLALDLDTWIAAICARPTFALDCPKDAHLQIEFVTDPASLSSEFNTTSFVNEEWWLHLPTPGLVGLPQGEAGYDALARGYGMRVAGPVLQRRFGVSGEMGAPAFVQALQAWYFSELALRPYPLTLAEWQALQAQGAGLEEGENWVSTSESPSPFVLALFDFLLHDLKVPSQTLVHSLASREINTYDAWLQQVTEDRYSREALEERWQAYLEQQSQPTAVLASPPADEE